jgi:subtilase family serine protease
MVDGLGELDSVARVAITIFHARRRHAGFDRGKFREIRKRTSRPRPLPGLRGSRMSLFRLATALGVVASMIGCSSDDNDPKKGYFVGWDGPPAADSVRMSASDPDAPITILWLLETRQEELEAFLESRSQSLANGIAGAALDVATLNTRFGADDELERSLVRYFEENRLDGRVDASGSFGESTMTVRQAEAILGVSLADYHVAGTAHMPVVFMGTETAPTLPKELEGVVKGVLGLNGTPLFSPRHRDWSDASTTSTTITNTGKPEGCSEGVKSGGSTPNQLLTAYGIDALHDAGFKGEGQSVAFYMWGVPPAAVANFASCFAVPKGNLVVHGTNGNPNNWYGVQESPMDFESIITAAPELDAVHIFQSHNPEIGDLVSVLAQVIDPTVVGDTLPASFSFSGTTCEQSISATSRDAINAALARTVAAGVSPMFSAGDTGSQGNCTSGVHAGFPGSSRYATSVGGTSVVYNSNNTIKEQPVWDNSTGASTGKTGGGASEIYPRPSFQKTGTAVPAGLPDKRLTPDVSFLAGAPGTALTFSPVKALSSTNYEYEDSSQWWAGGGTSRSSPFFAGIVALLNQAAGRRLVDLNTLMYTAANADYDKYFWDVIHGNNKSVPTASCCTAGTHYDMASGLGSVKVDALAEYLKLLKFPCSECTGSFGGPCLMSIDGFESVCGPLDETTGECPSGTDYCGG